ncbi:hypothetical protein [Nakamurella leprariae]|uniref:Uncharacterized protein n=1 Tax=Nakamurella leprariae TaxID=2803911 RepID=A0A938YF57_9ACTN|nr:hypothetical protein [Nakamurella leprariae]MBM9467287.1 hypothetical protein [Nakamurella leprariae]
MSTQTRVRTARKLHRCDRWCDECTRWVEPGDRYVEHTEFPSGDAALATNGRPVHLAECRPCAEHSGRGDLFVPVTEGTETHAQ